MPRHPKPWYRKSRRLWYVEIEGKQYNLGSDREEAFDRYHRLMSLPRKGPQAATDSVVAIFDLFLEWTKRHRAPRTYEWYRDRLQWFSETLAESIRVSHLKPLHVQNWLDANPGWSDGHKRGCIIAVQRAFRWAVKMGYTLTSPIGNIEKPRGAERVNQFETTLRRAIQAEEL